MTQTSSRYSSNNALLDRLRALQDQMQQWQDMHASTTALLPPPDPLPIGIPTHSTLLLQPPTNLHTTKREPINLSRERLCAAVNEAPPLIDSNHENDDNIAQLAEDFCQALQCTTTILQQACHMTSQPYQAVLPTATFDHIPNSRPPAIYEEAVPGTLRNSGVQKHHTSCQQWEDSQTAVAPVVIARGCGTETVTHCHASVQTLQEPRALVRSQAVQCDSPLVPELTPSVSVYTARSTQKESDLHHTQKLVQTEPIVSMVSRSVEYKLLEACTLVSKVTPAASLAAVEELTEELDPSPRCLIPHLELEPVVKSNKITVLLPKEEEEERLPIKEQQLEEEERQPITASLLEKFRLLENFAQQTQHATAYTSVATAHRSKFVRLETSSSAPILDGKDGHCSTGNHIGVTHFQGHHHFNVENDGGSCWSVPSESPTHEASLIEAETCNEDDGISDTISCDTKNLNYDAFPEHQLHHHHDQQLPFYEYNSSSHPRSPEGDSLLSVGSFASQWTVNTLDSILEGGDRVGGAREMRAAAARNALQQLKLRRSLQKQVQV